MPKKRQKTDRPTSDEEQEVRKLNYYYQIIFFHTVDF
jgi:hypothetical protein